MKRHVHRVGNCWQCHDRSGAVHLQYAGTGRIEYCLMKPWFWCLIGGEMSGETRDWYIDCFSWNGQHTSPYQNYTFKQLGSIRYTKEGHQISAEYQALAVLIGGHQKCLSIMAP